MSMMAPVARLVRRFRRYRVDDKPVQVSAAFLPPVWWPAAVNDMTFDGSAYTFVYDISTE